MNDLDYDFTAKQVATNELSAIARLDRPTEDRLYRLYRDFFRVAEEERRWGVWNDIDWSEARAAPPADLVAAGLASYCDDLFLPDYSAEALRILRASRGRAWFLTRWSYEEAKHLLALNEWLTRKVTYESTDAGATQRTPPYTDVAMRELTEAHLRTYRWSPPDEDPFSVMVDMLLWETREIERYTALRDKANEAGDRALIAATKWILGDEAAHRDFLRTVLAVCGVSYGAKVEAAVAELAVRDEFPGGAAALSAYLAIPAADPH